jgi:DNA invertase Pin-like site-specific DNA recombinase
MLSDARKKPLPFDVIVVHSFSRFARDFIGSQLTVYQLEKQGVKVVSMTQEVNDGPDGHLTRNIMQLMDEYQSKETAKHTLRAMEENARQGFWNGSQPPFGYKVVEAEKRGQKAKKKLAVHTGEAPTVRDVFRLYLSGTGRSGPMGIKHIVSYMNERGRRQRNGKPFNIQFVHKVLRNPAYIGTHYFNKKDWKGKQPKARDKWIPVSCPALIERATFKAVGNLLTKRNPKKNPARTVTNAILLSGLVKCGSCGGAMTLRAGKSGRLPLLRLFYPRSYRSTQVQRQCSAHAKARRACD